MTTESERCVDELIKLVTRIDELSSRLESGKTDELLAESKMSLEQAQLYIENNKPMIPSFILKKVTDSLNRLRKHIEIIKSAGVQFKFTQLKLDGSDTSSEPKGNGEVNSIIATADVVKSNYDQDFFGLRDISDKHLTLKPNEVDSKDVRLVNLINCSITIIGFANTIYVRNLKNTSVVVCLASRAITITDCNDCEFKFICQQLRIDSTMRCSFSIFTSARSMLESSKDLTFRMLDLGEIAKSVDMDDEVLLNNLVRAKFDRTKNNWKCIDDFDWLSPDTPSLNYKIKE